MAQLVNYLPCSHKDLSSIPRIQLRKKKKAEWGDRCLEPKPRGDGGRQVPEAHRPASLAYLVNPRPVRDPVSKKGKQNLRTDIIGYPLTSIVCAYIATYYVNFPSYIHNREVSS